MDEVWKDLVREGKEIGGRTDKDQWRLGELANEAAKKQYGKDSLSKFAKEIGQNHNTLGSYRRVVRAWPNQNRLIRRFSVLKELSPHPNRFEIIQANPRIDVADARAIMKEWREANRSSGKPKESEPSTPLTNRRQINDEIERRVQERIDEWWAKMKPHVEDAQAVKRGRKGLITKEDGLTIERCLHPDNSASDNMRNKAFAIWRQIKNLLLSEQDAPTVIRFPGRKKSA